MPNSGIAESRFRELSVADGREGRLPLRLNVLQLLQRSQRGFHKAVLFLMAFDQANQITAITESTAQQVTKCFGLVQQAACGVSRRSRRCTQTGTGRLDS